MSRSPLVALLLLAGAALAQSAPQSPETPAPAAPEAPAVRRAIAYLQAQPARATWFGVRVAPLGEEARSQFEIASDVTAGVVIAEVIDESPAARAGLRAGDVITSFGDQPVTESAALVAAVRARKPGEMVSYVVRRGTGTIAGTLKLGAWTPVDEVGEGDEREEIEEEIEIEETPSLTDRKADLERRATELREQVRMLQERMEHVRSGIQASKSAWGPWIDREERALEQARKRDDHAGVMVSQVRLDLLRELRDAGAAAPAAPPAAGLQRIEHKLDRILEMLAAGRRPQRERAPAAGEGGTGARAR